MKNYTFFFKGDISENTIDKILKTSSKPLEQF